MNIKQIKKIKKKSATQEKRTAKEFSGSTTPASGAKDYAKGDVSTGRRQAGFNDSDYLIENKYTDKDFYKLDYATWDKIQKEALKANMRIPLMQIDIMDASVVVLKENDLLAMKVTMSDFRSKEVVWCDTKSIRLKRSSFTKGMEYNLVTIGFIQNTKRLCVVNKDFFLSLLGE